MRGDFGTSLYFKTEVLGLIWRQAPDDAAPRNPLPRLRARHFHPARRLRRPLSATAGSTGSPWPSRWSGRPCPTSSSRCSSSCCSRSSCAGCRSPEAAAGRISSCRRSRSVITSCPPSCGSCAPAWSRSSPPITSGRRGRKGYRAARVVFKHALRNAVVPVVALSAVQLGFLLGGSVVIETVFALDGLGYLAYQSITHKDFPVTQAVVAASLDRLRPPDAGRRRRQCVARSAHPGRPMSDATLPLELAGRAFGGCAAPRALARNQRVSWSAPRSWRSPSWSLSSPR